MLDRTHRTWMAPDIWFGETESPGTVCSVVQKLGNPAGKLRQNASCFTSFSFWHSHRSRFALDIVSLGGRFSGSAQIRMATGERT